jgi:hypothetical protein
MLGKPGELVLLRATPECTRGLTPGHLYEVSDARDSEESGVQLLHIRSVDARLWSGPYSDGDEAHWDMELEQEIGYAFNVSGTDHSFLTVFYRFRLGLAQTRRFCYSAGGTPMVV